MFALGGIHRKRFRDALTNMCAVRIHGAIVSEHATKRMDAGVVTGYMQP